MVRYLFATDEQKELAQNAYNILKKELEPKLAEYEEKEYFPMDILKKLADAGYYCMGMPEERGGLGMNLVSRCIVYEEMAKIDAGFTFSFYGESSAFIGMSNLPEDVKQMWYDKCLNGTVGTMGLTEPDAGSDALNMRTTAVFDEKTHEWVLNGTKCFISNAPIAEFACIVAYTDKSKGARGVSMFFVEKERGFEIGKKENKMGLRLSPTSEISLNDVRVPEDHVIGGIGNGFLVAMSTIEEARVATMIIALGVAQSAVDHAVEYAKVRRQGGKRIIDHQQIGAMIAQMQTKVDAARALLYYAAKALDEGINIGTLSSEVKVFVSEMVVDVTVQAIQVFGGYGYMKDYPVEKLMRDARIFPIFEGTNQINLNIISKALAGKDPVKAKA